MKCRYGDWFYEQGDQEAAMNEYILTIPYTNASYVIRRYLDTSQIHMLIRYLEQLHLRGVACSEHTRLLINCYTKLHDHKKLRQFIEEDSLSSHYDPQTAVEALTSAGFFSEALQLASNHHLHEWYVSIQVEKTNSLKEAMNYITTIPPKEAAKALTRYGKKLVDVVPELVTPFLIHLCTEGETQAPQQFIICFVDNAAQLKQFLLAVTQHRQHNDPVIWNTLLELMLRTDLLAENEDRDTSVLELLQRPDAAYEIDEALVLLQRYDCEQGLVYLYQKLHMQAMLLQQYYHMGQHTEALQLCQKCGKEDPALWELLLQLIGESEEIDEKEVCEILDTVERSGQVPLLRIVQLLCDNTKIPVGVIKELVIKQLRMEKSIREADETKQHHVAEMVETCEKEIQQIQENGFRFKQTRCVACGLNLELPAVHFLCGHSFHKACVDMEKGVCPRCGENDQIQKPLDNESFQKMVSVVTSDYG